ncbi:MAG: ABC transporter ATP-binding protein, partial [Rhodobacteraceae bacterium]|nr:ABC transporter ATP-binding protein [Paracoccaceae bacterium]
LLALWLRERFSAVYVTHNLAEAVRLGHRIVVLSRRPGRIREVVKIDIPLPERPDRVVELDAIQRRLWGLMRDEAAAADRELADAR